MSNERLKSQQPNLMTEVTRQRLMADLVKAERALSESKHEIGEAAGISHDWHDNFAFEQASRDAQLNMSIVIALRASLGNIEIIQPRLEVFDVGIGNNIKIQYEGESQEEEYCLLGPSDVSTQGNWISFKSPLGEAMLGKKVGDIVDFEVNNRKIRVKLTEVLSGNFNNHE